MLYRTDFIQWFFKKFLKSGKIAINISGFSIAFLYEGQYGCSVGQFV